MRPIGGIFHPKFYVLEKLCVPQRLKIAAQRIFIVDIAFAAEDACFQRVAAHAAVAKKFDAVDDKLLVRAGLLLGGSLRVH